MLRREQDTGFSRRVNTHSRIEDEDFWKRIDAGEAFAEGDRLRVHLRITASRTANGKLKVERTIPRVIEVEHVRHNQPKLFENDLPGSPRAN